MLYSPLKTAVVTLAALLLADSLSAQPAPPPAPGTPTVKTKIKRTKASTSPAAPATAALPAPGMPPLPPAGGPGMAPPPAPSPGRGPKPGGVQVLSEFSGTLTGYVAANDDQVYDSFGFKTSTGTDTVRFPRHLGQALMAAAKPGSAVTITGFRDTDPRGHTALHLVSMTARPCATPRPRRPPPRPPKKP